MCWNGAYINTRKLCCTVVLTGNETNDSQVLLHITFSCRYETMTDTWEEFPPPIFPTLSPETLYAFVSSRVLRQTHFTLSRWTWTKCSHHTVLLSVIVSTGHASLLFSFLQLIYYVSVALLLMCSLHNGRKPVSIYSANVFYKPDVGLCQNLHNVFFVNRKTIKTITLRTHQQIMIYAWIQFKCTTVYARLHN